MLAPLTNPENVQLTFLPGAALAGWTPTARLATMKVAGGLTGRGVRESVAVTVNGAAAGTDAVGSVGAGISVEMLPVASATAVPKPPPLAVARSSLSPGGKAVPGT